MTRKANSQFQHLLTDPLVISFQRHLRAEGYRQRTIDAYLGATLRYLLYCEREHLDPLKTRRGDIQGWVNAMRDERLADASVNNFFRGLRSFFDWLADEEEIDRSPFGPPRARVLQAPAVDPTPKDVVTREDLGKLVKKLEREKRWRDLAVIGVLYDTGMRASELAGARQDRLQEEIDERGRVTGAGWLTIDAADAKGKRERVVRLSPAVMRYFDRYWRMDGKRNGRKGQAYLVNGTRGPMTRSGVYQLVRDLFKEIGVTAKIGAHDLRHTAASHMAEDRLIGESEAMGLFGWKSASMWRHYSQQAAQKAALRAHEVASPMDRLSRQVRSQ